MKIVGVTMGKSLQVFLNVHEMLNEELSFGIPSLFVADSINFKKALRNYQTLEGADLLKEWELVRTGAGAKPDMERISRYERRFSDESLWNALLADRRIFFGRLCKSKQDYSPRFTYTQLMGILDTFLVAIDNFLEKAKPEIILSFGTATLGDYLFCLFAKEMRIPYLQLKSTKIKNYIALNDSAVGISGHLKARFFSKKPFTEDVVKESREYMRMIEQRGIRYEGAILFSRQRMMSRLFKAPLYLITDAIADIFRLLDPVVRKDNHIPPRFRSSFYKNIIHPIRTYRLGKNLPFLQVEDLEKQEPFLFYPLHFEPEVSLQIFGRPFQNQIETVRQLAMSVPVKMKVIVKEHPRSLGFRKASYYKKLLDIPNVKLVDPFLPAIEIVRRANIVAVVSGTIGLEAAVCRKPLIVLGTVPYQLLPDSMVRKVNDIERLGFYIKDLLENYTFERSALERYFCSVLSDSIPLDFYTVLLRKRGRYAPTEDKGTGEQKTQSDYELLASYLKNKIDLVTNQTVVSSVA